MLRKAVIVFVVIVFAYIISYFINMHHILRLNQNIEELDLEYEVLREEHLALISEHNYLESREYLSKIAEENLGMYLPKDFEDYAFYQESYDDKGNRDLILLQLLNPPASAMSTKFPSQLK